MSNNDFLSVFLIALGLSADCFAVALSGGISKINHSWPRLLRVSFSFGLFQVLMPVLGWLAGRTVVELIADYDHWVAFAMLAIVSGRMLWESFRSERGQGKEVDITRGLLLITLSIATSIDALAVGISFAFLEISIVTPVMVIGTVTFILSFLGVLVGDKIGHVFENKIEILGGIILIGIGVKILYEHLL